jgi:hypothetical protein
MEHGSEGMSVMITSLSFGGGKETTAMIVLIATERLARPEAILMADTGSEREETYAYLRDVTVPYCKTHGLEIQVLGPEWRTASHRADLETYCLEHQMLPSGFMRWCTHHWKLDALSKYHRQVLGASAASPVESWVGISAGEAHRAKPSMYAWEIKRFPLIEMGLTRADCEQIILAELPSLPIKSGCWFCPFQSRAQWQQMKRLDSDRFARALAIERNARPKKNGGLRYLPMFGSLEAVAAQDELPGFDEAIEAEAGCVTGACLV